MKQICCVNFIPLPPALAGGIKRTIAMALAKRILHLAKA